ncbi:MAG: hypothetical protein AAF223_14175, partial [Bacteroidota bacterium]
FLAMKNIIAVITIGAATASLQVNAQGVNPPEEQLESGIEQEVIDKREIPSADYQHNQYGTYPQGEDTDALPQTRVAIRQDDLPEQVLRSFENSDYGNQEIVAIYKVADENSTEMQQLSDEPISDPTYHNNLNERSQVEFNNSVKENITEENQDELLSNAAAELTYEIEVKDNSQAITLIYSGNGELINSSKESEM